MTQISTAQVRQFLLDRYAAILSSAGVVVDSVSDDYDLLQDRNGHRSRDGVRR
jgi:hypothetical protein